MVGDFIDYPRSDSGLTTGRLQTKGPRWYSWLVPICVSLLVVVLISQASAVNTSLRAISAVDNQSHEHERGELDDGCPSVPCPELVVQLPEAQESGPETVVPLPEPRKSGPEIIVPLPEAQKRETNVGALGTADMTTLRSVLPQLVLPGSVLPRRYTAAAISRRVRLRGCWATRSSLA
jgi:hypothetical protein